MSARAPNGSNGTEIGGTPPAQLVEQVGPFELELAARCNKRRDRAGSAELLRIEAVASTRGFVVNGPEVSVDRGRGRRSTPEALELGMVPVAASLPCEDRLREQCLAPECNEAASIEVARVNGPEPHDVARAASRSAVSSIRASIRASRPPRHSPGLRNLRMR